jgi:hypothetical protein
MPIRAEFRHLYGREWRESTRPRIIARAQNKCEQCAVPNHTEVTRVAGWWFEWLVSWGEGAAARWRDRHGRIHWNPNAPPQDVAARTVRVVLTIAHLNHVAGDDRDENLKALCQWCHLNYDLAHHHETRAARKDAARPLLSHHQPPTKEAIL